MRLALSRRRTHALNILGRRVGEFGLVGVVVPEGDGPGREMWSRGCWVVRESRIPPRMAMPMVPQPRTVSVRPFKEEEEVEEQVVVVVVEGAGWLLA